MITLHIEADSAFELHGQLEAILKGVRPSKQETDLRTALDEASDEITIHEELPAAEAPAKKTRAKKAPAQEVLPPEPTPGKAEDDLEPPAFLDRRPAKEEPKPEPAQPEVTVEAVREAMSKVLAKDAGKMADLTKMLAKYKGADGKPVAKASQVQASDRPAVIAACEAMLGG